MEYLQRLLVLLLLSIFILLVNADLPSNDGMEDLEEPFPTEKCESILRNCSCYDYEVVAGIDCSNISDFNVFSKTLADGSIFEFNTTYEITIMGVKSLPRKSMEGLIVYRLYLDDPGITEIEDGAFEGVLRLRRFHVRQSGIKKIPDFRIIRDSFRNLNFDNSLLTSLDGQGLQDLYLMETLSFVNNAISHVDPDVFKGTNNVVVFDISRNKLTSLPPNLLDNWKNIRKVVLSRNHLVHVDNLFKVVHPRFIYIDFNNVTDIDRVLYPNMTNVETLLLASNPFEKVSNMSFNGKVPNVRFIYMDHCNIREFDVNHYSSLRILAILDLSWNRIEKISNQRIAFGKHVELDLIGNQIASFEGEMTFAVKRIYLTDNALPELGRTLKFTQVTEVSVAKNQLKYLCVEDFRGVHGMANLELQKNRIRWIDRRTFVTIRNDLHYLDLSSNLITSLNRSISYLSQLKALNVSENLIMTFEEDDFTGLNELSELYLQHNRIVALSSQLQQLPRLQFLVATHNNIRTLKTEQIPQTLQFLYLDDNPLRCDCKLLPFLHWLNSSESPGTDVPLCLPPANSTWTGTCPDPCACSCTKDGDDSFLTLDCSSRNISILPSLLVSSQPLSFQNTSSLMIHLERRIELDALADSQFMIRDQVLGVNLENNSFQSVNSIRLPSALRHLHLARNQLKHLPETVLYALPKLKKMSLARNPWDCNCSAVGFKKWLVSKTEIVQDVNMTRCSDSNVEQPDLAGKVIWTLTDLDLCPTDIALYVSATFGLLTFLLLCAGGKILYTRYEMNIKVYLYSRGVTWVKEKDIDQDKRFDAFISFSHKDEAFVINQIISVIESKAPNVQLCLHYKHFMPGEFIQDNIINAVQNSKRTVLVLSRNFLESEWCLMEFRAAHVQALKDKVHRIIVIKVGELPKEIDPAIQVYLDSTTYLTWGEKYFWNNLLYVLPTSGKFRSTSMPTPHMDKSTESQLTISSFA